MIDTRAIIEASKRVAGRFSFADKQPHICPRPNSLRQGFGKSADARFFVGECMSKRRKLSQGKRDEVMAQTGGACFYCGYAANCIDHIMPHSWAANDSEANLVPACDICNSIAGNKHFDSLNAKKEFILSERASLKWRRRISAMTVTVVRPAIDEPRAPRAKKEPAPKVVKIKTPPPVSLQKVKPVSAVHANARKVEAPKKLRGAVGATISTHLRTLKTPSAILAERHSLVSWREMANELDFNKGILSAIVSGNRRASDRLILKINEVYGVRLTLNPQLVPVCQNCGKPHDKRQCGPRRPHLSPAPPRKNWQRLATWSAAILMSMTPDIRTRVKGKK